jgi:hypothetical protein
MQGHGVPCPFNSRRLRLNPVSPAAAYKSGQPTFLEPLMNTRPEFPVTSPLRRASLFLAAALFLPSLSACASGATLGQSPVEMTVVDRDSNQVLPVYRKDGRVYVAGRPAARYSIRLNNRSDARVLVVVSVDGVNVISGQTAAWGQRGYVLSPRRSYDIAGWRKSDAEIAAFEFAALSESYAAQTGRPGNVGVIGMAVFLEKPAPPPPIALSLGGSEVRMKEMGIGRPLPQLPTSEPGAAAPPPAGPVVADAANGSAKSAARQDAAGASSLAAQAAARAADVGERLGTAHGQREVSQVQSVAFERASTTPVTLVELSYDSYPRLVAAGVIPQPTAQARAFPGSNDGRGYVADPPQP